MPEASIAEREVLTGELWRSIGDIYAEILVPLFLRSLTDGTLSEERFRFCVLHRARFRFAKNPRSRERRR